MVYHRTVAYQFLHKLLVHDRVVEKMKIGVVQIMLDVRDFARGKVVDHRDVVSLFEQGVRQVGADDSAAACDQHFFHPSLRSQSYGGTRCSSGFS